MSRKHVRLLKFASILSILIGLGLLWHPGLLLAAPFALGAVGDGGDDGGGDDDSGGGDDDAGGGPDDSDDSDAGGGGGADDGDEGDGDEGDERGANGAGGRQNGRGRGRDRGQMIPAYRLQEQERRLRTEFGRLLTEESGKNRQLLENLQKALGGGGGQDGQAPLTPQQQKLRSEFLNLFPEFKSLLELSPKSKDLLDLAGKAPNWDRETDSYWNRVADQTRAQLHRHVAQVMNVKKLDPETASIVTDGFISWVKADRTGERNFRYEGQDGSLITEFWKFFTGRFRAGAQRGINAQALERGARPMPRGGQGSTHFPRGNGGQKPKPKGDQDPFEEVNSRAWNQLQSAMDAE